MKKQELIDTMKLRKTSFNVLQYNVQLDPTIFKNKAKVLSLNI